MLIIYDYIVYNRVKFDIFWKKNFLKFNIKLYLGGKNIKEGCE